VSDFVGYDATQNDRALKLGVVTPCEMHRIIVVDTGENRDNCKTKDSVLEPILGGFGEYTQHDVGSFERLPTWIVRVSGGMPRGAV
jgi:hypothetical protein